jgi:hypothetical protein
MVNLYIRHGTYITGLKSERILILRVLVLRNKLNFDAKNSMAVVRSVKSQKII